MNQLRIGTTLFRVMQNRRPPQLDMTPDGMFRTPPRPPRPPLMTQIGAAALMIAVLTGVVAAAALAFWLALSLIPVAIIAGLIAWVAFRIQIWRMRRSGRFARGIYRT